MRRRLVMATTMTLVVMMVVTGSIGLLNLTAGAGMQGMKMPPGVPMVMEHRITPEQRQAAAERAIAARRGAQIQDVASLAETAVAPATASAAAPSSTPDYFGTSPNYANSPLPPTVTITNASTDTTGTGAVAIATVQTVVGPGGVITRGVVTAIKVINGGTGYTAAPTITITPAYAGDGTGATATAAAPDTTGAITQITVNNGGSGYSGIRKFVDRLPGLTAAGANNFGQYIQLGAPDTASYPGSDYYEIGLVEYSQQFHSDLPASKLRGYVQLNDPATKYQVTRDASGKITGWPQPHYLGPTIVAQRDRPVRIKFVNLLPTGAGGDLFIPMDNTVMGAGAGPTQAKDANGNPVVDAAGQPVYEQYTQNRATLHLHGGLTPWISDGTPHQWTTPAGEATSYPKGVSTQNVPDMPPAGPGEMTFFYSNQQSARLMFYHDHAYGITRLNVYAGEAAGYVLTDKFETALINGGTATGANGASVTVPAGGVVPDIGTPLVIQDKTFVPPVNQLNAEDPTWPYIWRNGNVAPAMGNLWLPHVYMPNQNPADLSGTNAMGRWDYSQWFWPPTAAAHGTLPNPYYVPGTSENPQMPGINNPSLTPEAFMDTPIVNGVAYPYLPIQQKVYRFRILNASNDRTLNLQLYYAKSSVDMWDAHGNLNDPNAGEVSMVPAVGPPLPMGMVPPWPNDNRLGGVPDQKTVGPSWIQIGTEGGFLPAPVVLKNRPVGYENNLRNIVVTNVNTQTLMLAPAERADVLVDFSKVPAGSKLILYNDSPAPVPAFDPRYDYYTGDWDQTSTGGAPTTLPGYGPNTRTIMQFQVSAAPTPVATTYTPYDQDPARLATLRSALNATFAASQDPIIVPQPVYNGAYGKTFGAVATRIQSTTLTFTPNGATAPLTVGLKPKAIQELFETEYGRMNATLGVEIPNTTGVNQTTIPLGYIDPTTENIDDSITAAAPALADGTQIWKITHNGVDTHAIHFHLFNVQIINRVGWDGQVRLPELNEIGWKDTVRMNPLEDAIVALRPIAAMSPFGTYQSIRSLDVTKPVGSTMGFWPQDQFGNPVTTINKLFNFGDEYVWHCHLLGHEENDMMRPIMFNTKRTVPDAPVAPTIGNLSGGQATGNKVVLNWLDSTTPSLAPALNGNWANPKGEIGYIIQRAPAGSTTYAEIARVPANATTYTDSTVASGSTYLYRIVTFNDAGASTAVIGSNVAQVPSGAVSVAVAPTILAPSAPTNLAASFQAAPLGVNLTWTAATGTVASYTVARSDGKSWPNITKTSFSDTPVVANTPYTYTVTAVNAAGSSPAATLTVLTLANAPTGLSSTPISAPPSIILNWYAPAGPGVITGYTIERSSDLVSWLTIGSATATTFTDNAVIVNATYFYRVRANNATGASAASQTINVTVQSTLPAAPINVTADPVQTQANPTAAIQTQVNLSWAPGSTITVNSYQVQRSTTGAAGSWTNITTTPNTSYNDNDPTLTPNTTYFYQVIATNATLGTGPASSAQQVLTLPLAPTSLTGILNGSGGVDLVWGAPASGGAATYQVQRSNDGGTTWTNQGNPTATLPTSATPFTDATIVGGTTYSYRVVANNATPAAGPASNVVSVTVPQVLPSAVSNLTATALSPTGVSLTWTAPTGTVTGYQIQRRDSAVGGAAAGTWGTPISWAASPYTDSTTATNSSYDYQVIAINGALIGPASNPVTKLTLPGAPTAQAPVLATAPATGVVLNWTAPGGNGALTYTVEWAATATATTWTTLSNSVTGTTTFNDPAATNRFYRITATNATGSGPVSNVVRYAPAPNAPTGLTATLLAAPSTSVRLSWTAPTAIAGYPVTAYTIERQISGGTWTNATVFNPAGTTTTYTDASAVVNTSYDYRVKAINSAGTGAPSNIATRLTRPAAPTITAIAQAGPQIVLTLTSTGTGTITGYTIQRRTTGSGNAGWGTIATNVASPYTDNTSVVAGTSYDYRATATNAAGTSTNSATVTVVATVLTVPTAPTLNAPTASGANVALSWTNGAIAQTSVIVQRAPGGTTTFTSIATLAGNATTYTDTTVTPLTAYIYRVYATNAVGSSPNSAQVTITTLFPAPTIGTTTTTRNSVTLSWTSNSPNATGFYIERSTNGTTWTQLGPVAKTAATTYTYTDNGRARRTTYQYRVRAYYAPVGGTTIYSLYSAIVTGTTL